MLYIGVGCILAGYWSLGTFYHLFHITDKAPITKTLLGTLIASHIGLQIPMLTGLSKYLVCLIPSKIFLFIISFKLKNC